MKNQKTTKSRANPPQAPALDYRKSGEAAATEFVEAVFNVFEELAKDCTCSIGEADLKFEITNEPADNWFGHVIAFKYTNQAYRIFFAFEFNAEGRPIIDKMTEPFREEDKYKELSEYATNYWIKLEQGPSMAPEDGSKNIFILLVDGTDHHPKVDVFPHHQHTYDAASNRKNRAEDFNPVFETLIELLTSSVGTLN